MSLTDQATVDRDALLGSVSRRSGAFQSFRASEINEVKLGSERFEVGEHFRRVSFLPVIVRHLGENRELVIAASIVERLMNENGCNICIITQFRCNSYNSVYRQV